MRFAEQVHTHGPPKPMRPLPVRTTCCHAADIPEQNIRETAASFALCSSLKHQLNERQPSAALLPMYSTTTAGNITYLLNVVSFRATVGTTPFTATWGDTTAVLCALLCARANT